MKIALKRRWYLLFQTHLSTFLKDIAVSFIIFAGCSRFWEHVRNVIGRHVKLKRGLALLSFSRKFTAKLASLCFLIIWSLITLTRLHSIRKTYWSRTFLYDGRFFKGELKMMHIWFWNKCLIDKKSWSSMWNLRLCSIQILCYTQSCSVSTRTWDTREIFHHRNFLLCTRCYPDI